MVYPKIFKNSQYQRKGLPDTVIITGSFFSGTLSGVDLLDNLEVHERLDQFRGRVVAGSVSIMQGKNRGFGNASDCSGE